MEPLLKVQQINTLDRYDARCIAQMMHVGLFQAGARQDPGESGEADAADRT